MNIVVVKVLHFKQRSILRDTLIKYFCSHLYFLHISNSALDELTDKLFSPRLNVSCTHALLNASSSTSVQIRAPISTSASVLKKEGMLRAQMRFATGLYSVFTRYHLMNSQNISVTSSQRLNIVLNVFLVFCRTIYVLV